MSVEPDPLSNPATGSKLPAYLRLLRLSNLPTALADVLMGFLVTHPAGFAPMGTLALLAVASCLLYCAGMVLNDLFDREVDKRERPERPIPSGRVSLPEARRLGWGLLLAGVAMGAAASLASGDVRSAGVAAALALVILAYDGPLKRTPAGPLAMGTCRLLNVLLGMSAAPVSWADWNFLIATGVGLYIAGVTWFARTEARESSRGPLLLAVAVMMAGIYLLAQYPEYALRAGERLLMPTRWPMFWMVLATLIGWRCLRAVADPQPHLVQAAVKHCLASLIVLDAAVCFPFHPGGSLVILALLIPTMLLGRWIRMT